MTYKPDFGLYLSNDGMRQTVEHNFYNFSTDHITVISHGAYTMTNNILWVGTEYAVSHDFDNDMLEAMLLKMPPHVARHLKDELERDPYTQRTIELPQRVEIPLSAKLGELQVVAREEFIPFIVQQIL